MKFYGDGREIIYRSVYTLRDRVVLYMNSFWGRLGRVVDVTCGLLPVVSSSKGNMLLSNIITYVQGITFRNAICKLLSHEVRRFMVVLQAYIGFYLLRITTCNSQPKGTFSILVSMHQSMFLAGFRSWCTRRLFFSRQLSFITRKCVRGRTHVSKHTPL